MGDNIINHYAKNLQDQTVMVVGASSGIGQAVPPATLFVSLPVSANVCPRLIFLIVKNVGVKFHPRLEFQPGRGTMEPRPHPLRPSRRVLATWLGL